MGCVVVLPFSKKWNLKIFTNTILIKIFLRVSLEHLVAQPLVYFYIKQLKKHTMVVYVGGVRIHRGLNEWAYIITKKYVYLSFKRLFEV